MGKDIYVWKNNLMVFNVFRQEMSYVSLRYMISLRV